MSEVQREQERDVGPGGGERSEPEPGPTSRGRPGPRAGQAQRRYTPEERRAAIEALVKSGLTYEGFARIWGVSRHTIYMWMKQYRERGPAGLEHPCGEGRPGRKPLVAPLREEIVLVQRRFPDFGLRKVRDFLARFRGLKVSTSGVRSAIVAAGLPRAVAPKRRGRGRDLVRRFERSRPGELWQSDITSYVLARQSRRAHLIVYLDDFSRYVVSWSLHLTMTAAIAGETLLEGVARFGKPKELLTDQGPQYFAWRGRCGFQKLLEREGIGHVVARTHHPQTLGKCERLWETVGRELWDRAHPQDLAEARTRLAHFIRHYNHFRPHQGIGGLVPADRFFGAQDAVRKAVEAAMTENELRLALGERPRKSVFLFGQIGDEQVSLHGERGRLVVQTPGGAQEMDLNDMGFEQRPQENDDDQDADADGDDDGDGRDEVGAGDGGSDLETRSAQETAGPTRTRRGRGRRRLGNFLRPVYPIRALWEAASEEERRQAHARCATLLEYWLGAASKQEAARRLSVPAIRVWQKSQRAAAAMVCGLLKPPSGKRGRPAMEQGEGGRDLKKENARLAKENALLRDLVSVLREMPGNKDREIAAPSGETPKEAEATKPRKKKSRESRALPSDPPVDSPPSS